jgi:hypothetical protein
LSGFVIERKFIGTVPLVAGDGPQAMYEKAHAMIQGDLNGT